MHSDRESALAAAWQRRAELHGSPDTDAYRLINRAGDGFPRLSVDRYADVLVANVYSGGVRIQPPIAVLEALAGRVGARAVYVKYRPLQASGLGADECRELVPAEPVLGEAVESVDVRENGLHFVARPADGLNAGLFLDMRQVRALVRAHAAGKTVLNCFAYTCAFAVAALTGGATRVLNLDISRRYLDWGKLNVELNGFAAAPTDFVYGDVFDWLQRFGKRGQKFDLVVVDPPSYSTTRQTRFSVERDTPRLVALAANVVRAGGLLIACTNCEGLPQRGFAGRVREGLDGFPARIVRTLNEPTLDFPLAPGASPYLKVCVAQFG